MATGGEKDKDEQELERIDKKEEKDGGNDGSARSWLFSGLKVGAALKVGALLGVTTLGATALGAVAVGAYAAVKLAQQIDKPDSEEEDCGGNVKEAEEPEEDTVDYLPPDLTPTSSDDGSGTSIRACKNLVDELNRYYHSRIRCSAAKLRTIRDLVEKIRQSLSAPLLRKLGSLIQEELTPAAIDKLITKQRDERTLLLPLALNPQLWEFADVGETIEILGSFCIRRVNLDTFSIGTSPWDSLLSGSYLNPELVHMFLVEEMQRILEDENVLGLEYDIKWNEGCIKLSIENPVKGYADMLCINIVPCVKIEKGSQQITLVTQRRCSDDQEPATLASIPLVNLWCRSLEQEAMLEMERLDTDGGCRHKCVILLESVLATQPSMRLLSLYHVLTIVLKLCEEETEWDEEMLAERFLDILKAVQGYLRAGSLRDYFLDKVDLLDECSPGEICASLMWLDHMFASTDQMPNLLVNLLANVNKH